MKKFLLLALCLFSAGCGKKDDPHTIKVAASSVPHAQMLNFVKPKLKKKGYELKIYTVDDYMIPNRALAEKEVDANFFQHIPFMDEQIKQFHYSIECLARIHLEPMAIYSSKYKKLEDIPELGTIALPNDPTNEYRALKILEGKGLITLRQGIGLQATKVDIVENPKRLKFQEIETAMLPRILQDADAAAIPTNYALQADLNPKKDALAVESLDSPYANIIAIRKESEDSPKLEALKEVMLTKEMRKFIEEKYKGAIIPVLKDCPKN